MIRAFTALIAGLIWTAAAEASDWVIQHHQGNLGPDDIYAGSYYLLDTSQEQTTVTLPEDRSLMQGCTRIQKRDPSAGRAEVVVENGGAIGAWLHITLPLQDDWVEVCSDGIEYVQIGGMGATYGPAGQHRTFSPVGAMWPLGHWYFPTRGDRGALLRWNGANTWGNGGIFLPALGNDAVDGLYRNHYMVGVQAHNLAPGQQVWVQALDGRTVHNNASIVLTRDLQTCWFDTAGDEWTLVDEDCAD